MPVFEYLAKEQTGRIARGQLEAASLAAVRTQLQARGLRLLSVQLEEGSAEDRTAWTKKLNPFHWLPPRSVDVEISLEQLAVMLRSGLSLLEALKTVTEQARFAPLALVFGEISEDIQEGASLADAMARHKAFPVITVQLVRVGESTGNLDLVLDRAAAQMRSRRQNVNSVLTALAYPAFVAIAAFAVAAYLVLVVIPELQKFLGAMGRKLPAMTQALVDFAEWLQINGTTTLVVVLACGLGCILVYLWPPGRFTIDRLLLRVPIVGNVLRLSGTVTFASSLAVMLRSGITVLDSLRTVERLHKNQYLASRVSEARDAVIRGEGLSRPLKAKHAYMPMLGSMMAVAENTGQMDEVLETVATFHETQLQAAIKRLSVLVEPAVIIVVGGIVGYVYMAFFVALFSAGGSGQ